MSHIVPESVETVKHAVMGSKGSEAKVAQLEQDMVEPTKDSRITSDFGTKQASTDDWLKVNNEQQTGPMLIEDPFAREKVSISPTHSHSLDDEDLLIANQRAPY
jgi:catalase